MAWFKVDDGFWSHPKTLALSSDAIALWVRAGAWSCQQLTDGLIPDYALPMFGIERSAAHELVQVRYWCRRDSGYEFHDWGDYQEHSDEVKERRKRNAEKMRKWREAKARNRGSNPVTGEVTNSVTNPGSNALPDPTRPDPTSSVDKSTSEGVPPSPPSPFCKRHQASEGTDHPCRGCKLAAQKYDEYMTEAAPPDQPYVHEHRWMPDGTCMTCEEVRPG